MSDGAFERRRRRVVRRLADGGRGRRIRLDRELGVGIRKSTPDGQRVGRGKTQGRFSALAGGFLSITGNRQSGTSRPR